MHAPMWKSAQQLAPKSAWPTLLRSPRVPSSAITSRSSYSTSQSFAAQNTYPRDDDNHHQHQPEQQSQPSQQQQQPQKETHFGYQQIPVEEKETMGMRSIRVSFLSLLPCRLSRPPLLPPHRTAPQLAVPSLPSVPQCRIQVRSDERRDEWRCPSLVEVALYGDAESWPGYQVAGCGRWHGYVPLGAVVVVVVVVVVGERSIYLTPCLALIRRYRVPISGCSPESSGWPGQYLGHTLLGPRYRARYQSVHAGSGPAACRSIWICQRYLGRVLVCPV